MSTITRTVARIEVHPAANEPDPLGQSVRDEATQHGLALKAAHSARVFLIEAPLDRAQVQRIAEELLADRVNQRAVIGASPLKGVAVEVHYKPGVMDPVAQSTREAIVEMLPELSLDDVEVRTGFRYDLVGTVTSAQAGKLARAALANPVIQDIHLEPYQPDSFVHTGAYEMKVTHVAMRELDDAGLTTLSRQGHLFLSLAEMQAIRDYYRRENREPTDIELETLAQTWSEHCVHKTLTSTIRYRHEPPATVDPSPADFTNRPGHTVNPDGSVTIRNLLKSTIAAATHQLMKEDHFRNWCVSVFKDNAGIVRFDEVDGVAIKVETHNHPSAIEPYGGAATGIGGCIRDIMGTGQAAQPIANTDVFCVARPDTTDLPKGVIPPRRILQQVVAGVRDYGNRMGIPTVNGSVFFDQDFLGNPLVFAGCVGLIPLDRAFGAPEPGDHIIALGGRTGRDGIHGATFSSAELTDTHADEFSHAVQIGNAITQKKTLDVILEARDQPDGPLFHAITDCGAGGFSSAVGETAKDTGARVKLDAAPLKYQGLSYTEIWISEAQERMVLAVPPKHLDQLRALCEAEDVEICDLGEYGVTNSSGDPELVLTYRQTEVGRLSMTFLHDGLPTPTREAEWSSQSPVTQHRPPATAPDIRSALHALLSHPNIASKHWIVRQYDHEVQGGAVIKPLTGPRQDGPSDAAVLRPKLTSQRGIAIGHGLQPHLAEKALADDGDSYWMALAAIDEAVRNVVCVGADPDHIAILDNFCWPSCDQPRQLGALVRAAEACYDGALAYRTPFVSGKDSLNNQFTTEDGQVIAIPPTLLITALAIVTDAMRCRTMDAKAPGNVLLIVGQTTSNLGGSHYVRVVGDTSRNMRIPRVDLKQGPAAARAVADLIAKGLVQSAHDCSDGGLLVAAAEMAFAGRVGLALDLAPLIADGVDLTAACFAESPSRYVIEAEPDDVNTITAALNDARVPIAIIGTFKDHNRLTLADADLDESLDALRDTWHKPLDW